MIIIKANPPQNGDRTHHHDQSITWHNLRTIKAVPNKPKKPTPLLEDEEFDIKQHPHPRQRKSSCELFANRQCRK